MGAAAVLDTIFRMRMARAGQPSALVKGGAFNYAEYHKIRSEHGWAGWPVYLMWVLIICGIALLIAGFFIQFGAHSNNSSPVFR
jgi:hypothetical protein